jgi:hypothetical protein
MFNSQTLNFLHLADAESGNNEAAIHEWAEFNLPSARDLDLMRNQYCNDVPRVHVG